MLFSNYIILFNVYFYIVHSMFPLLFNWSQSKGIVNLMSHIFLKLGNISLLFSTFWKLSYSQRSFDVYQRYETLRWNSIALLLISIQITLIWRWKWNKIQSWAFNVTQHWYDVVIQHWDNAKSMLCNVIGPVFQCSAMLFQGCLNISQRGINVS